MEDHRVYEYHHRNGWKPINDPLAGTEDWGKSLTRVGYSESVSIGDKLGVHFQLYGGSDKSPYPYLIDFCDGGEDWLVYCGDFPSAFELMHKFAVICQAATMQEVYDETEALRRAESERTDELHRRQSKRD